MHAKISPFSTHAIRSPLRLNMCAFRSLLRLLTHATRSPLNTRATCSPPRSCDTRYNYFAPNGWTVGPQGCNPGGAANSPGLCRAVVVQNSNTAWGGLSSGHGTHFIALQNFRGDSSASVSQSVVGLVPGKRYTVSVRTTLRPGSGSGAVLNISLTTDGATLLDARVVPFSPNFTRYVVVS